MMFSKLCYPSSKDDLPSYHIELSELMKSRISSIQTSHQCLELVWATARSMSYGRLNTLPSMPFPHPVTTEHRTPEPQDPHTTAPECEARLRHTQACHASLRKCTMRRETFIRIHICRPTFSCFQSSLHKPRFQRPENSHPTQVQMFCEQYAGQGMCVKRYHIQ